MLLVRRFLVFQAILFWQGGFLFYAAVVVPTGTEVLGSFAQGRVTRHVTDALNIAGIFTLLILAWDQLSNCDIAWRRRGRWALWSLMLLALAALMVLHPRIESHVDFAGEGRVMDYPAFYGLHRIYLWVSMVQWIAGTVYAGLLVGTWSERLRAS